MKFIKIIIMTGLASLFITGCQPAEGSNENSAREAEEREENHIDNAKEKEGNQVDENEEGQRFPVTIELDDQVIEIEEKPEHILPLSLDVAEILLELVDSDRVVAVPQAVENPILSTQSEKADEIPGRIASAVNIDPEEIISLNTDLLLLTKVHGQEEDTANILDQTGLPIISFNTMRTVNDFQENIAVIGEAIGETENAMEIINKMTADIEAIQAKIPADAEAPSVLILSEVGPGTGPFMMGPGNISYDLIQLAGATAAVDEIDLQSSTPASIEQVISMDPDYIFLLDFVGNGEEAHADLIQNPGWSSLQAVEEDRVKVLDVKYLMNPNVKVVEGLEMMVDWIYGLEE